MKTAGLVALLIALSALMWAEEPDGAGHFRVGSSESGFAAENPKPEIQNRKQPADVPPVRRELNQEFQYEAKPEASATPESPPVAEQKVEKLERVVVTAPARNRQLDDDIRLRDLARLERRFALLNGGGTILGRQGKKVTTEVQLKLVSVWEGAGVNVLRFSW